MQYFETDRVIFIFDENNIVEMDFSLLPPEDVQPMIHTVPIHILAEIAEEPW
jgi:hypothetical protein